MRNSGQPEARDQDDAAQQDLASELDQARIAVLGLGYVGLPLAIEFGAHYPTVGFDIDSERIGELLGTVITN